VKRIISLIRFDLTNALRDSMVLYILVAPIFLALALGFIATAVEGSGASFAVDVSTEAGRDLASRLGGFGTVESFQGKAAVERRVLEADDIAGFVYSPAGGTEGASASPGQASPAIILQGNEGPEAAGLAAAILASALEGPEAVYRTSVRDGGRSAFKDYARISLAMLSVLIGGVAAAFALVEEKESKLTRAFAVAPLSEAEYFAARGLWSAAVGTIGAVTAHLIMGPTGLPWWHLAAALAASVCMPLSVCLLIGGLATNQIQAVASLKLVMFAYLALPFGSLFVPERWTFLFWPLPNYWMFEAFRGVYIPGTQGFPQAIILTAVTGASLAFFLGLGLRKRLSPGRNSAAMAA
jgi:ABC-2 type transport system permease protein